MPRRHVEITVQSHWELVVRESDGASVAVIWLTGPSGRLIAMSVKEL